MGADIMDELELMRFTRIDPIRENAILKRAKDEIVRLRGEVAMTEQQKADRDLLLTGTSFMRDGKRIDPATVRIETPAPAMPSGVEYDRELIAEMLDMYCAALTNGGLDGAGHYTPSTIDEQAQLLRDADNHEARTVIRAADNRDAAGVEGNGPDLYSGPHAPCIHPKHPPAAVPAGEAVAYSVVQVGNRGAAYDPPNTHRAFTYEHQPGNIDASRLGRATNAAAVASAGDSIDRGLSLLKELQALGFGVFQIGPPSPKESPQPADGGAVALWISRHWREDLGRDSVVSMVNREDPAHTLRIYVSTTPPAPVQAAPQEGEASRELAAARAEVTTTALAWGRNLVEGGADGGKASAFDDAVERLERAVLAAHPSACELEAVRELVDDFTAKGHHSCARDLKAALQHRGDSQEVGRG